MIIETSLVHKLLDIPEVGVYGLINETEKKVYITYSEDMLGGISRLLRNIKDNNTGYRELRRDIDSLSIKIIETVNYDYTKRDLRDLFRYWSEYYVLLGYTLYRSYKALQCIVAIEMLPDLRVAVTLRNKALKGIIMGIFKTMSEANSFVQMYNSMDIIVPVYALNEDTREYYRSKGI